MIFSLTVPEGEDWVLELNADGIDYLCAGLERLRSLEPGETVSTPALNELGVAQFVLRRAADADPA